MPNSSRNPFRSQSLVRSSDENGRFLENTDSVLIRRGTDDDIPAIERLARSSESAAHWSDQQYESILLADSGEFAHLILVALFPHGSTVLGFLVARHLAPEWELENIAVARDMRGKGIGTRLMQELIDRANETNSESVFLEVRESNAVARSLYQKLGFRETGRRKSYYTNPLEDAILCCKALRTVPPR